MGGFFAVASKESCVDTTSLSVGRRYYSMQLIHLQPDQQLLRCLQHLFVIFNNPLTGIYRIALKTINSAFTFCARIRFRLLTYCWGAWAGKLKKGTSGAIHEVLFLPYCMRWSGLRCGFFRASYSFGYPPIKNMSQAKQDSRQGYAQGSPF